MKKLALTSTLSALLAATSHGDIVYSAPGMEEAVTAQNTAGWGTSISANEVLGHFYEYQITGIEWQLGAGVPPQGVKGNGDFKGNAHWTQHGESKLSVSVAGYTFQLGGSGNPTFTSKKFYNIDETDSGSIDLSENPIIVREKDLHLVVTNTSNMTGDVRSYVVIKGFAIKDSLDLAGSISTSPIVREGAKPYVDWELTRSASPLVAPDFNLGTVEWSSDPDPEPEHPGCDSPNAGANKTNNGHGNNIDGVDVSNPGKSAEKWAARGIIDVSGSFDDEKSKGNQ